MRIRETQIRIRIRMRSGTLAHFYHSSKIKSHKEVTKQKKSRFFLLFLLDDRRIRIREDQTHTDRVHNTAGNSYINIIETNSWIHSCSWLTLLTYSTNMAKPRWWPPVSRNSSPSSREGRVKITNLTGGKHKNLIDLTSVYSTWTLRVRPFFCCNHTVPICQKKLKHVFAYLGLQYPKQCCIFYTILTDPDRYHFRAPNLFFYFFMKICQNSKKLKIMTHLPLMGEEKRYELAELWIKVNFSS